MYLPLVLRKSPAPRLACATLAGSIGSAIPSTSPISSIAGLFICSSTLLAARLPETTCHAPSLSVRARNRFRNRFRDSTLEPPALSRAAGHTHDGVLTRLTGAIRHPAEL